MSRGRTQPTDDAAYAEGRKAAEEGRHFKDACPYTFGALGVSQEEFERTYRAKLNGWFDGWADWLHEHGLNTKMRPVGEPQRAWTAARRAAQGKKK